MTRLVLTGQVVGASVRARLTALGTGSFLTGCVLARLRGARRFGTGRGQHSGILARFDARGIEAGSGARGVG
ncbi:MAG: hypothetical protein WC718_18340, partial [Phycisphaerales bacterium]